MKTSFALLTIGLSLMVLVSCTRSDRPGLPPSTGGLSEVLVITPNQVWETSAGFSLKSLLSDDVEGLNQSESMYDILQIEPADFSGLFEKNRKIIRLIISDTVDAEQVVARNNVYSEPQVIIDVCAKSDTAAIRLMKQKYPSMVEMMKSVERERLIKAFKSTQNNQLKTNMKQQFGFSIVMPESFYQAKTNDGFAWYRLEAAKYSQAIMVYTRNFVDSTQLEPMSVIQYRNYITKQNIPGELPGSYMSTDTLSGIYSRNVDFAGSKATECRGLWKTEGDFMGGPFVSYTFHDKASAKVITLEGYVYYPNNDKRDLLMQLEAMLYSYSKSEQKAQ